MTSSKHAFWGWAALLALCGLTFFLSLGGLPLVGPDEPRYAEIGREMWASSDWITPRMNGYLWLEKPIWLYWWQAASYHLFGVGEFAARFPSAVAALLCVVFLAWGVGRLVAPRWGLLSGAVLATSGFWLGMARSATTDMGLACWIGVAVLAAHLATHAAGRARAGFWLLFAFGLGVSMLAKGLIGVLLICAIVGLHRLLMKKPVVASMRRNAALLGLGALVFAATIAVWYVPVTLVNGMTFINEFFVNHHFKRFFTNKYHHLQPAYFYPFVAFVGVLPWSFFLPGAVARLRRLAARDSASGELLLLAWVWAIVPIAFFSLSKSKLPAYILPSFPALAILIGWELERIWRGESDGWSRFGLGATSLIAASVGVALAVFVFIEKVPVGGLGWLALGLAPLAGLFALGAWLVKARRLAIGASFALTASVVLAATIVLFPFIGPKESKKQISLAALKQMKAGENLVYYRKQKEYAPVFYAQGRVLFYQQVNDAQDKPIPGKSTLLPAGTLSTGDEVDALTPGELMLALRQSPTKSALVMTLAPGALELEADARLVTRRVAEQDGILLLRVGLA